MLDVKTADAGTWTIARGEFGGMPLFMRLRRDLVEVAGCASHPDRLNVIWSYGDAGVEGLPPEDALDDLDSFEERLFAAVEKDLVSICIAVATTTGRREWIFYTSDAASFLRTVNETFSGDGARHPIGIEATKDPGWLEYLGILRDVEGPHH